VTVVPRLLLGEQHLDALQRFCLLGLGELLLRDHAGASEEGDAAGVAAELIAKRLALQVELAETGAELAEASVAPLFQRGPALHHSLV
jgi:hypothetical protein